MTTVAEIAADALKIIDEHDWGQGLDRAPKVCIGDAIWLGSVSVNKKDINLYAQVVNACLRVIYHEDGIKQSGLACWNDQPERTKEDVVLCLKHVAAGE